MATSPEPLATWTFQRKDYVLLQAGYGFAQQTDALGRPSTTVRPLRVELVLDAADEDARLVAYMFDSYQRAHSELVQRHPLSGRVLHRLHIQAAYCVGYRGSFAPGDGATRWPSEVLTLHLTAAALTLDGVTVECHSVLPWAAPEEVRRRARMLGDETRHLAAAAALPAPKRPLKIEAPAIAKPPALTSNSEKGVYGEHISDAYMLAQGHTKLNDGGLITPPPPGGTARGNGIDGVWKHGNPPPDYIITEAKYDTSRLGMTLDGRQMSNNWITGSGRLQRAVGRVEARNIIVAMARGRVEKRVHKVSLIGTLIETVIL